MNNQINLCVHLPIVDAMSPPILLPKKRNFSHRIRQSKFPFIDCKIPSLIPVTQGKHKINNKNPNTKTQVNSRVKPNIIDPKTPKLVPVLPKGNARAKHQVIVDPKTSKLIPLMPKGKRGRGVSDAGTDSKRIKMQPVVSTTPTLYDPTELASVMLAAFKSPDAQFKIIKMEKDIAEQLSQSDHIGLDQLRVTTTSDNEISYEDEYENIDVGINGCQHSLLSTP